MVWLVINIALVVLGICVMIYGYTVPCEQSDYGGVLIFFLGIIVAFVAFVAFVVSSAIRWWIA